ncbi:MAG: hypothetical protein EOP86_03850 [Verrucomicrobiaceae bacterium]|nr:MAG: hypothetical protein EOP86_03850 [Verrucomicrobiaceae bacterium]
MPMRSLLMVLLPSFLCAATPQEEIAAQVPAARAILDGWQAKDPVKADRKLHIVYWTPADRHPAPRYRERLSAVMRDIRKFYGSEMERLGFGFRTFTLDEAADGLLKIHVVTGAEPYAHYDVPSGDEIRKECLPVLKKEGLNADEETIVLFCNMSNWDSEKRTISQNSPYYAYGTNRWGTAWQVDSPMLDLESLSQKEPRVLDGQYGNISVGRYNSIFIGGIAHELGHAFGYPHNVERADEGAAFGTALMGSGNRTYGENLRGEGKGSFLNLAHALQLASHPLFCGSIKGWDNKPSARPSGLSVRAEGKTIVLSGKVTGDEDAPVYAVQAYFDPEGGSDYDATSASAVPGQDGGFTLTGTDLVAGKGGELRLFFLQADGVASGFVGSTPYRYPYTVAADGTPEVKGIAEKLTKPD